MTIFIIVGIVIIAGLLIFFSLMGWLNPEKLNNKNRDPYGFFEECIKENLIKNSNIIGLQGGYLFPGLSEKFEFEEEGKINMSYLCYTRNYFTPCINQEPMLIEHLRIQLKKAIKEKVEGCFNEFKATLSEDYETEAEYYGYDLDLKPGKINLDINGKIIYNKGEETYSYENISFGIVSKFYDLGIVAQEIVSKEARFCSFEIGGYMLLYPEFDIDKTRTGDGKTIYKIKDKITGEKFIFAIRGCVSSLK